MEHGSGNQEVISVECLDPLAEDVVVMRSKSAEPLGRAKSPGKSKPYRTKRSSAVDRPKYHFHDRQSSEDKKDRRRRHSSSSKKKEPVKDLSARPGLRTPDRISEHEAEKDLGDQKSSISEKLLDDEKEKVIIQSPGKVPSANRGQHSKDDADEQLSEAKKDGSAKAITTESKPEIIRSTKVSRFVEVSPKMPRNGNKDDVVRPKKSAKFVDVQHKSNESVTSKEPSKKTLKKKDKKASRPKKSKKKRKRKSSSSSLSSYSYSDSDSSIVLPAKKYVSKLALCEVPESSNRPPPPPPRPPRSDQTMDSHIYENYPIHKNGSNAPATMTAEIIKTPIIVPSPLKRKSSDLKIPPSPSHSPMLRRKSSGEFQKKSPEKEAMNPQFKLGSTRQTKGKPDGKLDRRVSVAASIFGDVIKRRPPTHRHVDNRPQNPLEEIRTQNFNLRKTFQGGAINLERPVPGLGRVLGEDEVPVTTPAPLNRRQSAPPGYLSIRPEEPNILGQIAAGVKLRSVPKPVESRIGLGRVIEDTSPAEDGPLPQIPTGKQNNYTRLLSDIKEIGDQIEEAIDDVVDKVVSKSQPPPPPAPPPPPPTSGGKAGISRGPSVLDQIKNRGFKLRKVPPPQVKVHLVTDTDHLDVPAVPVTKQSFEKGPADAALPKLQRATRPKLSVSNVASLDIPPHLPSSDESESLSLFRYRPSPRTPESVSYATKTAAILSPSPIQSPSQFLDSTPDNLQSYVSFCFRVSVSVVMEHLSLSFVTITLIIKIVPVM